MNLLPGETLLVLPFLVVLLPLIGSTCKWLVASVLDRNFSRSFPYTGDLLTRLVVDFALGAAAVPVLFLLASFSGLPLSSLLAYGVVGVCGLITALRLAKARTWVLDAGRDVLSRAKVEYLLVALVAGLGLFFRLAPYADSYVFDGNDIRQYTLVTQLLVAHQALPTTWGPYAFAAWNPSNWVNNHLIFEGSEALFGFLSFVIPVDLPQLVSATVLLFNAAVPVLGYVLVRKLFPERSRVGAFATALALAVVAAYPLFFEQWGGIDEITGWVIVLGFSIHFLADRPPAGLEWRREIVGAVFLAGLLFVTPIVFAYALCFLAAFAVETLVRREGRRAGFASIGVEFFVGILLVSPLLLRAAENALQSTVSAGAGGWGTFATAPIIRYGDPAGSLFRIETLTSFQYAVPLVVVGEIGVLLALLLPRSYRHAPLLAVWGGLLFLLNENGPFGLFLIPYPAWNSIFPDRVADFLFVIVSIGTGIVASFLWELARSRPSSPPLFRRPRAHRVSRSRFVRGASVVLLAGLLLATGYESYYTYEGNQATVIWGESLVSDDLAGMQWVAGHVPKNDTILVDPADAGSWIPELDGIRVYPYAELISNYSIVPQYDNMTAQLSEPSHPNFTLYSQVGRAFDLGYAYLGGKHAYGLANPLPLLALVDVPPVLDYASSLSTLCTPKSNQSVSLCGRDAAISIAGPLVLSIGVSKNSTLVGSYVVSVPANTTFTYVNEETEGPGAPSWSAVLTAVPPSEVVYRSADEKVFVLQLAQGYFGAACTGLPPMGSCSPTVAGSVHVPS